ncbi:hypothetical protein [Petrimonas mucosa]|jgi:hypothetical protein|uniref:Uncharacterized protein n=1 Tax=Petrimonas mucosa TaxID=1642646 RepID=A0A1G4G8Y1_9BACT|nr:hypothetical protein [Petrimonas mucosa]MCK9340905.1 hypothetical protein [Synergistaceae bacterium]MCK9436710.1 hypothetical protein [Synergistaceae bacterium]MDY0284084.1 hypothetical protein [Synergistaceae bacterium]SCM58994.1 putative protein {ECO:0000313/EMBL:CCY16002,1} [Petrimonas mucosa]
MAAVLEESAWEETSKEFLWTEQLLEKHKNKVNWKAVSQNSDMLWTTSMLEKFKAHIDWHEFSLYCNELTFTFDNANKFHDYWDWQQLSKSISTIELLDKFLDYWDWNEIIDNRYLTEYYNKEFLEKYINYIPMSSLQQSMLWRYLISEESDKIKKGMLT